MADLLYSWAKLEENIANGDIGYFHGKATRFLEHRQERFPDYIWLVRKELDQLWLLGKLWITDTPPKNFPKNHDPDFIFYDQKKSVFFDDVISVKLETEDIVNQATRTMQKSNFQGIGSEGVLELAEQRKLEFKTKKAVTISFDEFMERLKKGSVPTPPYRLGARIADKSITPRQGLVRASSSDSDVLAAESAVSNKTQMSPVISSEDGASDWSVSEVDLAVSDYFAMLSIEAKQGDLNKAAHNAALRVQLNGRTKGSVEFKHQNISAVLSDLGLPYLRGYKPLGNYQQILRERVEEYIISNRNMMELIFQSYESSTPDEAGSGALTKVDPPSMDGSQGKEGVRLRLPRKLDFSALDEQNRALGFKGEEWVFRYEQKRLRDAGLQNLAEQVKWTARDLGDGTGYDIQSFSEDGSIRYIEVKTTNAGAATPFYVSQNEVDFSEEECDRFFLYRVFDFSTDPRFYELQGSLNETACLEVGSYRARPLSKSELGLD